MYQSVKVVIKVLVDQKLYSYIVCVPQYICLYACIYRYRYVCVCVSVSVSACMCMNWSQMWIQVQLIQTVSKIR